MKITNLPIDQQSALLIVDMQYDFLPGGALPVKHGDEIISPIIEFAHEFYEKGGSIIFTQDWHPKGHYSFASAHPGRSPGDPINTPGLGPILWPDHCVQGTVGAEIHPDMPLNLATAIIRKGFHLTIDSYSAFLENDKKTKTGLAGYLQDLQIQKVFVCGLALDYCCFYTAMDAKSAGFEVYFLSTLTQGIDEPSNNVQHAFEELETANVQIIS